jgi:hypothetical protein
MFNLAAEEQRTLELIASRGEHTVFDGGALCGLFDRGLVALSIDGWEVTPLGRLIVDGLDVVYGSNVCALPR